MLRTTVPAWVTSRAKASSKLLLTLLCAGSLHANTFYVNDGSTAGDVYTAAIGNNANSGSSAAPYLNIQNAIDAASAGDTIYVDAGTYNENAEVNKSLTILGAGNSNTIIDGDNAGSGLGTFHLSSGGSNIQIGAIGQGFHVKGLDGPPGLEKAAIYLQGAQTNITIEGNIIEARGDAALMGEYNAANNGVVINDNMVTGQTFTGPNPAGQGSGAQFSLPNVPRQAVIFGGGSSTTHTMNFTFTNNVISAVSGGQSITDNSGNPIAPSDQGNMLVTLDLIGTNLIRGNTFDGTTVSWYAALRTRGTGYTIDSNSFDGTYEVAMATAANPVNATLNYWGDASGPFNPVNNPCGAGKYVPNNVTFSPFYVDAAFSATSTGAPSVTNITQGTGYCSIQAAVDAANPTDTLEASAGTFTEQVEIDKDLMLMGQGAGVTFIKGMANMPLFFTTSQDNYPVVYVHDAGNVILTGFTLDGDGKGNTNYRYQGIAYSNAGGLVDAVEVTGVRETPLNGNQHGIGIFADAAAGTARVLTVQDSKVIDFQKNAMSFSGADLTAKVLGNEVIGAGPLGVPLPAQNGVQYYGVAGGEITGNMISGIEYTPASYGAAGILSYQNVGPVLISENEMEDNEIHIYNFNGSATVSSNTIVGGDYGVLGYEAGVDMTMSVTNNFLSGMQRGISVYGGGANTIDMEAHENSITSVDSFSIEADGSGVTVNADCNWYGTADSATIASMMVGPVDYSPWLTNGTDNDGATGFQPVPGSCNGGPGAPGMYLVSDSSWRKSTVVTTATANSYPWSGVTSVPAAPTFTEPVTVGQPYPWEHIFTVDGSEVITSLSGVTYYRKTFDLTDNTDLNVRFRMFVDDNMQIFVNGQFIALEDDMGESVWRTANHDVLFDENGTVDNGHNGGDAFDFVTNVDLETIFQTGPNNVVLAIRNRTSRPDVGGFSFRMDIDQNGAGVIVKSGQVNPKTHTTASNAADLSVDLYPNPTKGAVQIVPLSLTEGEALEVMMFDINGRMIMNDSYSKPKTGEAITLDLSGFAKGVYSVRVQNGNEFIVKRVVLN